SISPPRKLRQPPPESETTPSAAVGAPSSDDATAASEPSAGTAWLSLAAGAPLVSSRSKAISVVWSRPAIVAGTVSPLARRTETSPSSASVSSAVTASPSFQTKPAARARCEVTVTIAGEASATSLVSADDRPSRGARSDIGNSLHVVHNLGPPEAKRYWPDGW